MIAKEIKEAIIKQIEITEYNNNGCKYTNGEVSVDVTEINEEENSITATVTIIDGAERNHKETWSNCTYDLKEMIDWIVKNKLIDVRAIKLIDVNKP